MRPRSLLLLAPIAAFVPLPAAAEATIECLSHHYNYTECASAPLTHPQLIHQISSAPCIVNNTWGFNRHEGYIWVGDGCQGVFADVGGYHHGKHQTHDDDARKYDHRGHDEGALVGAILGAAVLGAVAEHQHDAHHHHHSNR